MAGLMEGLGRHTKKYMPAPRKIGKDECEYGAQARGCPRRLLLNRKVYLYFVLSLKYMIYIQQVSCSYRLERQHQSERNLL